VPPAKREKLSASDIKQIRQRIEVARKYWEKTWKTKDLMYAQLYRGDFFRRGTTMTDLPQPLADNVQLNYLKRLCKLKVAALAAERPIFRFRPRGGGKMPFRVREAMARVWEAYIPYVWREARIHEHARSSLRDRYVFGRGWCWIDWKTETQELLYEGDRPESMPKETILYDNPIVRRVSPARVHIDPQVDTLTWEDAEYVCWQMSWPLERIKRWAKSDKRVKEDVAQRIKGDETLDHDYQPDPVGGSPGSQPGPGEGNATDKQFKRATIFRYQERERNLVVYLAKEIQLEELMAVENPYEFEGYPCEPMWGDPIQDKLDAIGLIEDMHHWQRLFNLVRSKQAGMIRSAKHIIGVQGAKEEDILALESGEDRTIIPIDMGAQMPEEANTTGFPPEFMQFEVPMRQDYTELSGVNAMRRGLTDPGIGTATETSLLVSQSNVGDQDEQTGWEDFNRRIAVKVKALVEQFGTAERIAAVSPEVAAGLQGPIADGNRVVVDIQRGDRFVWARFTPQEIADDHEIDVQAGSMGVREEAVERAQFIEGVKGAVEVAAASQALQMVGLNPQEIAKEIFRRTGNTDTERFFQPVAPQGGGNGMTPGLPGETPGGPGNVGVPEVSRRIGSVVGQAPGSLAELLQSAITGPTRTSG